MLKIGRLKINADLILAPLSGISDLSFRTLCRRYGAKFAFTEMLNACAIKYKSKQTKFMLASYKEDKPLGAQILGRDIKTLLNAVDVILKGDICLIDFNAACPVRKVVRRGEGSALLKEPKLLSEITRALVKHINVPLTVKIRSGWSKENINAVSVAKRLEDAGAAAIFIHARAREQLYSGKANYNVIRKVKESVDIPVIGSGDIFGPKDTERMFKETGCDAVLVARGALGNPWIFKQTERYLKTKKLTPPPTTKERLKTLLEHLDLMIALYGEARALPRFRLFIPYYLKGLPRSHQVNAQISKIKTKAQLRSALKLLE